MPYALTADYVGCATTPFEVRMCNGKVQLASVIRLHDGASCGSVPLANGMSNVLLSAAYEASAAAWVLARMRKAAGTLLSALEGIRCGYRAWSIASLI